jgi:hypothetical protein
MPRTMYNHITWNPLLGPGSRSLMDG